LDDGWPGKGVFPHAVAYCSGVRVLACGFGGGAGDGGRTLEAMPCNVRVRAWQRRRCASATRVGGGFA